MNTKRFFAAILAAVILSISFLACDPKDDDPTTNPTPSTDVVKEVYGFYGKPYTQVTAELDKKGWTKDTYPFGQYTEIAYFNSDTTKKYMIQISNDTVIRSTYLEAESSKYNYSKLQENANYYLSLFEEWDPSFKNLFPLTALFKGQIMADNFDTWNNYTDYAGFFADYQAKKTTLDLAYQQRISEKISGNLTVSINYTEKKSYTSVEFYSTY